MKKLLILLLLICSGSAVGESETVNVEQFVIGRFIIYRSDQGYQAYCQGEYSDWYIRAINAIEELNNQ